MTQNEKADRQSGHVFLVYRAEIGHNRYRIRTLGSCRARRPAERCEIEPRENY
jgi:hypothetical protein